MRGKLFKRKAPSASTSAARLGNTRILLQDVAEGLSEADVQRRGRHVVIDREVPPGGDKARLTSAEVGHVVKFVGGWWVAAFSCGSPPSSVADYCKMTGEGTRRVYLSQALFRRAFPGMKSPTELAAKLGVNLHAESPDDVPGVVMAMLELLGR